MPEASFPERVYHYTTAAGLMGILKSGTVWASHPGFMNDTRESMRGLALAKERLDEALAEDYGKFAHAHGKWGHWLRQDQMFVACFCAAPDLLAMWRGYAPDNGVSLGFSSAPLQAATGAQLRKVLYDESQFQDSVTEVLDAAKADSPELKGERLCARLFELAFLLKDPAWAEEQEWRLLSPQRRARAASELQFRQGRFGLVPYFPLSLGETGSLRDLDPSLMVGPGAFQEQFSESLSWFLPSVGVPAASVALSVGLRPS
ncbi:MAG: DUF2971 domain-containing protein [Actinobacteria bacterium]|nr:DUF2971 domain-containing protein [Actinomycetota bacterium]MCG2800748.1 DUF2971 domain-containing protein [Cellulomonas sp.]